MTLPTVVTFVSAGYIPIARNWLAALERAGIRAPVRLICTDAASRAAFPAAQVLYHPFEGAGLEAFWSFRLRLLSQLLPEVGALIHSDADAVWQRDPLPMIAACASDMVFSQGTVWPPDIHDKHGLVLCCGFFHLHDTPAVRDLLGDWQARVEREGDDQISLNRLLDDRGLRWEIPAPYRIPFRDTAFTASEGVIRSKGVEPLRIAVLPHHLFPRQMTAPAPGAYVAHPLSPKTGDAKIACLRDLGLWP